MFHFPASFSRVHIDKFREGYDLMELGMTRRSSICLLCNYVKIWQPQRHDLQTVHLFLAYYFFHKMVRNSVFISDRNCQIQNQRKFTREKLTNRQRDTVTFALMLLRILRLLFIYWYLVEGYHITLSVTWVVCIKTFNK